MNCAFTGACVKFLTIYAISLVSLGPTTLLHALLYPRHRNDRELRACRLCWCHHRLRCLVLGLGTQALRRSTNPRPCVLVGPGL
jgi:hypothetical protein